MPAQHVAIDFAEARIGAPADEPTPMRRLGPVERCRPRFEIGGEIGGYRIAGLRIPARPTAVFTAREPRARGPDIRDEPVHRPRRDFPVKRTRIGEHRLTHRRPIAAGTDGIMLGNHIGDDC